MLGNRVAPLKCFADRHFDNLTRVKARNLDGKCLGAQPVSTTSAAGSVVLIAFEFLADPVRVRLTIATLHVGDHAFEHAAHLIDAPTFVIAE